MRNARKDVVLLARACRSVYLLDFVCMQCFVSFFFASWEVTQPTTD